MKSYSNYPIHEKAFIKRITEEMLTRNDSNHIQYTPKYYETKFLDWKKKKKKKKNCREHRVHITGVPIKEASSVCVCADIALIKQEKGNWKKSRIDGFTTLTTHIRFPSARLRADALYRALSSTIQ